MSEWNSTVDRSILLAHRISLRTDEDVRRLVNGYNEELDFDPLEDYMISQGAWDHVLGSGYAPQQVFAHPHLLMALPQTSEYYRNMAMLPRKRVSDLAVGVERWESLGTAASVTSDRALRVAKLYNAVNCSIIEGRTDWTLDNGYRNMIANMGIGLDGTMRNLIGQDADAMVKGRMLDWLRSRNLIECGDPFESHAVLTDGYTMHYGSEPDIEFRREDNMVASIEIKGGRDPAGALERLGAAIKSFNNTPSNCVNFLVAGVITSTMRHRLAEIGTFRVFKLDEVIEDGDGWYRFLNELFHHTVRITDTTISPS